MKWVISPSNLTFLFYFSSSHFLVLDSTGVSQSGGAKKKKCYKEARMWAHFLKRAECQQVTHQKHDIVPMHVHAWRGVKGQRRMPASKCKRTKERHNPNIPWSKQAWLSRACSARTCACTARLLQRVSTFFARKQKRRRWRPLLFTCSDRSSALNHNTKSLSQVAAHRLKRQGQNVKVNVGKNTEGTPFHWQSFLWLDIYFASCKIQ